MTAKKTKCLVLSGQTAQSLDHLATVTGRSASSIAEEVLSAGLRQMILETLPDRAGVPFRFGLGSIEGALVARRRAGAEIQLKRQYSFELLGESGADLLALVYVSDGDHWRVPSEIESRDLVGVLEAGDQLALTTTAGLRWRISALIDTVDRRSQPPARRLIARLQHRSGGMAGGLSSLRGILPPGSITDDDLRRSRVRPPGGL